MSRRRFYLDTSFVVGLLNPRDEMHAVARPLYGEVRSAEEVWLTEAVLVEIGNGLASVDRGRAGAFLEQCYEATNFRVVGVDTNRMRQALRLYRNRGDKGWGMTDCLSFGVMQEQNLMEALTADEHFIQAGFRALLLED